MLLNRLNDPPLFYSNFRGVPVDQIAHVGVSPRISLKLFGREIMFEEFRVSDPCDCDDVVTVYLNVTDKRTRVTDRRTDGQTIYCDITTLCVASRGNVLSLCRLSKYRLRIRDYFRLHSYIDDIMSIAISHWPSTVHPSVTG